MDRPEARSEARGRRRDRLVTAGLLGGPLAWLTLFFLVPVVFIAAYSVGLVHLFPTDGTFSFEGLHPQAITSDEMMEQKLTYLHNNPVKRGLVASPEHWRYSSAHEWLPGAIPVLRCDPWR